MRKLFKNHIAARAPVLFAAHTAIICGIAAADYIFRPGISMLIPYILAALSVSWLAGKRWGFAAALVAAVAELTARLSAGPWPAGALVPAWNFATTLLACALIAHLAEYTRRHLEAERDLIRKDYLTGIDNVRSFYEAGSLELERCRRGHIPLTIVYVDIDDFESLNDALGHRVGDRALQSIASTLKNSLRITDIVARIGGDEFAILLPGGDYNQASSVVKRLQDAVTNVLSGKKWPLSVTTAAITYLSIPDSVDHLIKGAEESMNIAKQSTDNPVRHTAVTKLQLIVGEEHQDQRT